MTISQYEDYFYIYILLLISVPAIILGIKQIKIKYYAFFATIFMVILTIGMGNQMLTIGVFLLWEMALIKLYQKVNDKNKKWRFRLFVLLSLLPLVFNKISGFTAFGIIGFVGISYMSFKTVQIIIDIYDGNIDEIKLTDTLYFVLFFPTLSSGPIDRYRKFIDEINAEIPRDVYINDYLLVGIKKMVVGLAYKFFFASLIYIVWLKEIPNDGSIFSLVQYMYCYTLYLFFDFAGYSNMAIGTGYLFGVKVPENFDKPFVSKDMKEFWTRWHISLSRWFGDYIFSRFVLNTLKNKKYRKKKKNVYRVGQMITMTTMGIWHGLTWYYIAYGVYQGIALALTDDYLASKFHKKHAKNKHYQFLQIFVTFHIICFGMLIFSGYLNNYI